MYFLKEAEVPPIGSAPSLLSCSFTELSLRAELATSFNFVIISEGVPAGASSPYQELVT
jgi:hypothetical protein